MAATVSMTGWRAEFESLLARFGRLFVRSEPPEQAGRYLEGLLGAVKRKNGWQLAEAIIRPVAKVGRVRVGGVIWFKMEGPKGGPFRWEPGDGSAISGCGAGGSLRA